MYPPGEEPLPPHLRDAPDNSAGAPPANPGCEPACDIDDDIQVGVLFLKNIRVFPFTVPDIRLIILAVRSGV